MLTQSSDWLVVQRGVPSHRYSSQFNDEAATTWFTSMDGLRGAIADASWVTSDDEPALVEIGVVHRHHAQEVRNGFATIRDASLVDVQFLVPVERLSDAEMTAQGQAMLKEISQSDAAQRYVAEWLATYTEDDEDEE